VTALEVLVLREINEARADPAGYAASLGITLNEGLPAGTISAAAKPALTMHAALNLAADQHGQNMLAQDFFEHTDPQGHTSRDRMLAAGLTGAQGTGENIALHYGGSQNELQNARALEAAVLDLAEGLFISPGHRENILRSSFDHVGVGVQLGEYQGSEGLTVTQDFADLSPLG
jgi:uncharacterized protein YkwD